MFWWWSCWRKIHLDKLPGNCCCWPSKRSFFGVVLAGCALRAALYAKVKDVGVNELTSGAGGAADISSDVFVIRGSSRGRDKCVWINSSDGDILARLTLIKTDIYTSETACSTSCASIAICLFIKVNDAILDAFVIFQEEFYSKVGKSAGNALERIIDASLAIGIAGKAFKRGCISKETIWTSVRTRCVTKDQEVVDSSAIFFANGA
jgi:hypothetical protein